jgi:hypothetical protein
LQNYFVRPNRLKSQPLARFAFHRAIQPNPAARYFQTGSPLGPASQIVD